MSSQNINKIDLLCQAKTSSNKEIWEQMKKKKKKWHQQDPGCTITIGTVYNITLNEVEIYTIFEQVVGAKNCVDDWDFNKQ